jgi:hypothetical protein
MDKAIRDGFLKAHKEVVLMPEEYASANIFYRVSDLTYDAQFFFLMSDLHAHHASPTEWAGTVQRFLHDQSITLPPGALKMRFISNHDTVSWTFDAKRPAVLYGLGHMRALLAICALIDGVPMLYQGDEDPAVYGRKGESNVEFLSSIYQLRRSIPALSRGTADYSSVTATGGVFACLREVSGGKAIVLVSLNPEPVTSTITTPSTISGAWTDRLSGDRMTMHSSLTIPMAPYQVRVFTRL